jgi:Leucine-rich repeat (LRR) protein
MVDAVEKQEADAEERIRYFLVRFAEEYEDAHLVLATHAAFTPVVTPDLLYQLWANFKNYPGMDGRPRTVPLLAVSDLVLSLFRQTGREFFEMDAEVRAGLLRRLREDPRFGEKTMTELAEFLFQYATENVAGPERENFNQVLLWTALMTLDPQEAATRVFTALKEQLKKDSMYPSIGIMNFIEDQLARGEKGGKELSEMLKSLILREGDGEGAAGEGVITVRVPGFVGRKLKEWAGEEEKKIEPEVKPGVWGLFIGGDADHRNNIAEAAATMMRAVEVRSINYQRGYLHSGLNSNYENIEETLVTILDEAKKGDIVVIYFAGDIVEESELRVSGGSIPDRMLRSWIDAYDDKELTVVLILDARTSYSDWLGRGSRHLVLMSYNPLSVPEVKEELGKFTRRLVNCLERNPAITFQGMYNYLMGDDPARVPFFRGPLNAWDKVVFSHSQVNEDVILRVPLLQLNYISTPSVARGRFLADHKIGNDSLFRHYLELKNDMRRRALGEVTGMLFERNRDRSLGGYFIRSDKLFNIRSFLEGDLVNGADDPGMLRSLFQLDMLLIDLRGFDSPHGSSVARGPAFNGLNMPALALDIAFALGREILVIYDYPEYVSEGWRERLSEYGITMVQVTESFEQVLLVREFRERMMLLATVQGPEADLSAEVKSAFLIAWPTGKLDLSKKRLKEIPPVVFDYEGLNELLLEGNKLEVIPVEIGKLRRLQTLNLNGNPIKELPMQIFELVALEVLALSNTDLRELPEDIDKLTALKKLYVHSTDLTILPPALATMEGLEVLDARQCSILNVPENVLNHHDAPERLREYAKIWDKPDNSPDPEAVGISLVSPKSKSRTPPLTIPVGTDSYHTGECYSPEELFAFLRRYGKGAKFFFIRDVASLLSSWFTRKREVWYRYNLPLFFRSAGVKSLQHLFYDSWGANEAAFKWAVDSGFLASVIYFPPIVADFVAKAFIEGFFERFFGGESLVASFEGARASTSYRTKGERPDFRLLQGKSFSDFVLSSARPAVREARPAVREEQGAQGTQEEQGAPEATAEVLRRIDASKTTGTLDLSNLGLAEWPRQVFELQDLNRLDISKNKLKVMPPDIGSLTNLTYLDCRDNDIRVIPSEFGQLKKLEVFRITRAKIINVPTFIRSSGPARPWLDYFSTVYKRSKPLRAIVNISSPSLQAVDSIDDICRKARPKDRFIYSKFVVKNNASSLNQLAELVYGNVMAGDFLIIQDQEGKLAGVLKRYDAVYPYFSSLKVSFNLFYIGPLDAGDELANLILNRKLNSIIVWRPGKSHDAAGIVLRNMLENNDSLEEALRSLDERQGTRDYDIYYDRQQMVDFRFPYEAVKKTPALAAKKKTVPAAKKKAAPKKAAKKK